MKRKYCNFSENQFEKEIFLSHFGFYRLHKSFKQQQQLYRTYSKSVNENGAMSGFYDGDICVLVCWETLLRAFIGLTTFQTIRFNTKLKNLHAFYNLFNT